MSPPLLAILSLVAGVCGSTQPGVEPHHGPLGHCHPAGQLHDPLRLLLVGKTGSGKSSSGNTILQQDVFVTSQDFESYTSHCSLKEGFSGDTPVEVMDTPGLFDTRKSHDDVGVTIIQSVIQMHPGPDVILYVIRLGDRYTGEDYAAFLRFKALFGPEVVKHMIVLFTHGDALEKRGGDIEKTLAKAPPELKQVLEECSRRYVVLNNIADDTRSQSSRLLHKVLQLREEKGCQPYVCDHYSKMARELDGIETLKKEVSAKQREVEDREARTFKYTQQKEAEAERHQEELKGLQEQIQRDTQDSTLTNIALVVNILESLYNTGRKAKKDGLVEGIGKAFGSLK